MIKLTGRIRHRNLHINWTRTSSDYLVLQVEEGHPNGDRVWRDARTEDLTLITLNSLTEVKQQ